MDAPALEPAPRVAPLATSPVRIHAEMIQGSDEWLAARCGLLTASEMKLIVTPTLKILPGIPLPK